MPQQTDASFPNVGSQSQITVRSAAPEDAVAWNAFVTSRTDATFFHRFEWSNVLQDAFRLPTYFMLAETEHGIAAILPLAHVKSSLFGDALVSTPFCVYGGIIAIDQAAFDALESAACQLANRLHVDYLEMRCRRRSHTSWPVKDLYVTFRRPIAADSEANMLAIPRKQRAMVRKGAQRGLQTRIDDDVDDFYQMYSESLRNLGTPVASKSYFAILLKYFGSDAEILTVTHQDRAVSSVLSFRFREEILPYYGGGSSESRPVAANDFMYWQVMERARGQGLSLFDFGRSKRESGSFDFKKNWGFEPEPLCYEYFLVGSKSVPNLSPTNPKYGQLVRLWKRLPLPVANFVGPFVAKFLG